MNDNLQKKLFKKYPLIFSEVGMPPSKSCMAYGITCNDGWYGFIDCLCKKIQNHINQHNYGIDEGYEYYKGKQKIQQVVVKQLKEKFGTLRFYYDGGDDDIRAFVKMVESLSEYICEDCGSMKEVGMTTHEWDYYHTFCKECMMKQTHPITGVKITNKNIKKYWRQND